MDDSKGYFFFITDQLPLIVVLYRERYHNKSQTTLGVKTSQFSTTATVMHYQSSFCFSIQVYSPSLIYVKYRTLPDISLSKSIRTVKLQANIFNADKVRQVIQTMNMTLSNVYLHYHAVSSNFNSEIRHGNTHTHNRQTYFIIARYVISGTKFAYPLRELS